MVKIVKGNILNASEDIIGHQVNCIGVMEAGLALQIKKKFPNVFDEYRAFLKEHEEKHRDGITSQKYPIGQVQFVAVEDNKTVANIFGQIDVGGAKRHTDYEALKTALRAIRDAVTTEGSEHYKKSVALPYGLGCGLAGGSWDVVSEIIEDTFANDEVTLYKL